MLRTPETSVKPLIVAEHASVKFGGEALIPFQYFKYLRRLNVDVHLLVHERTRQELCEAFPTDLERLHFISDSLINIWCYRLGRYLPDRLALFTLGAVSHFDTQVRQRRMARVLIRDYRFNVVHEPIPVSPKQPSIMFSLGAPVIIGPMNGGMDYPPNYNLAGRVESAIVAILRWASGFWNKVLPGKRRAALLLVANSRTFEALPSNTRHKWIREFTENGVDLDRFHAGRVVITRETIQIIYVGRLVDWKRVDLLLSACARLVGEVSFQLHVVGEGPLRGALETQVRQLSLTDDVQFYGFLSQAKAAELLRDSDMMVLPSMRECGGAVVLEAMASGVPVIATDWGGPADYITEGTGILIPPRKPEEFVKELSDAVVWLAKNPDARAKMGQAGRTRTEQFYDWQVKAEMLLRIYQEVLSVAGVET
jgi:glycosyltransferase involved in cell wall biosynthesis